jgi:hypothetical protein
MVTAAFVASSLSNRSGKRRVVKLQLADKREIVHFPLAQRLMQMESGNAYSIVRK